MEIRITSSARLHMGFMDLTGDLGRLYGSIGLSLKKPETRIFVTQSDHLIIENDSHANNRIEGFVRSFAEHYRIDPKVRIRVERHIPEHKGLGSGSQMALSIATALAKILRIKADTRELAMVMGRGLRSGTGITGFLKGGLIIDAGKKRNKDNSLEPEPPLTTARFAFPEDWQFVLVIPEKKIGLSGEQEKKAMGYVSPSRRTSEEICRLVLMQMLPALADENIEKFGDAVSQIDIKTGSFFKPVQGGIYSEKLSYGIIRHMTFSGAAGAGQSSWGPAIYGLVHKNSALALADKMKDYLANKKIKGDVIITGARNLGARVEIVDPVNGDKA